MLSLRMQDAHEKSGLQLDCDIPLNTCTGVFGPSGAGKTTFLRIVAGLEQVSGVQLTLQQATPWQSAREFVQTNERGVGMVMQDSALFSHMTVQQNISFGYHQKRNLDELGDLVELMAIGPLLKQKATSLSGGEQQRVALVRALANAPSLLLLDEPLAFVDEKHKHDIVDYLKKWSCIEGHSLIYVSHSPAELMQLATHLLLFAKGRKTYMGPIAGAPHWYGNHPFQGQEVLSGKVVSTEHGGLTVIETPQGRVSLPLNNAQVGQSITIHIDK